MVLVAYDVDTTDTFGAKRLRKVAKVCVKMGHRVQNSVFECLVDYAEYRELRNELEKIADLSKDSLRFYNLGNNYESRIEVVGKKDDYEPEGIWCV